MPTYEYKCTQCKFEFERFQNMSDKPVSECPHCDGKVERLLSGGAGIIVNNSQHSFAKDTCCSMGAGCDNPKRCCERQQ